MEVIVLEDTPLAEYLEGEGRNDCNDDNAESSSSSLLIRSFAPRGSPIIPKYQAKSHLLKLRKSQNIISSAIHNLYSRTLDSRLSGADNARFLERFRYLIVASQLLNLNAYPSHSGNFKSGDKQAGDALHLRSLTPLGAATSLLSAFSLAWLIHWARIEVNLAVRKGHIFFLVIVTGIVGLILYAFFRRKWLQNIRHDTLTELSNLIAASHEFDNAAASALSLIQEVEIVSRGYQISSPLPPISHIEDRVSIRRCSRLRKLFRSCFLEVQAKYTRSYQILKQIAEELDLEKYYDIYDISDLDISDALSEINEMEDDDEAMSIRALKVLAARYNVARKIILCCLMAMNATGSKNDFHRWNITMEQIQEIRFATALVAERLFKMLCEEENFPVTPIKAPQTPAHTPFRERWRAQSRQLSSLSSGIRGLQAKLHMLREESDQHLNESSDIIEFGTNLMIQYDSLGVDLKALLQDWEDGKFALASNIDRNERRVSSLSGIISPTISLGGLTVVEEGGSAQDALNALNGEPPCRSSIDLSTSDFEEVFEAVALPQKRSNLSKEERLAKLKDDRAKRHSARFTRDTNTKILRELESVIKMRPKNRLSAGGRVLSM